jgi:hypothetical protein
MAQAIQHITLIINGIEITTASFYIRLAAKLSWNGGRMFKKQKNNISKKEKVLRKRKIRI